MLKKLIWI